MQKQKRPLVLLLTLCLLLASVLTGCGSYDNFKETFFEPEKQEELPEETLLIGIFEPLTGEEAENAKDEITGMELAHELYPFVKGKKIELVYSDNESTVEGAVAAAQKLVDEGVRVVLGSYSSVLSMAGGDVFKENHIPAIAATCTNPILTQTNDYYFRSCVVEVSQGSSAAYYVNKYLLQNGAAVLLRNGDEQAETMADQFTATMKELTNGEAEVTRTYLPAENVEDYTVFLRILAITGNRAVFFPCGQTLGKTVIYQESLDDEIDFSWVGTSQWDGIDTVSSDEEPDPASYLSDVTYILNYDAHAGVTDMSITLHDAYKEKYGEDAVPSEAVALGFDAYLLAREALSQTDDVDKGWSISSKLYAISDFSGATGSITINKNGDPNKDIIFERYMGGEFNAVYTAPPIAEN